MSNKSKRYNAEFKKQIVGLAGNGKGLTEIVTEHGIARSTLHKWIKDYSKSGSFKAKDNRSPEEQDLMDLRKENKQLRMENDILKQAALIMGRK